MVRQNRNFTHDKLHSAAANAQEFAGQRLRGTFVPLVYSPIDDILSAYREPRRNRSGGNRDRQTVHGATSEMMDTRFERRGLKRKITLQRSRSLNC